jgi:L-alanine-DL-glutamate epimerase-like enolase superfamily enzyme
MAQPVKERRKHVRRPVLLKCRIEGTSAVGAMQLTDLSESGCFVATSEPLAVGSPAMLYVTLSGDEIPILGRVVRVQEGRGFGVEIDVKLLSQYSRQTLERFLRQSPASVSF